MAGPKGMPLSLPSFGEAGLAMQTAPMPLKFILAHEEGHSQLVQEKYTVLCQGNAIAEGYSDELGGISFMPEPGQREYEVKMVSGHRFMLVLEDDDSTTPQGKNETV